MGCISYGERNINSSNGNRQGVSVHTVLSLRPLSVRFVRVFLLVCSIYFIVKIGVINVISVVDVVVIVVVVVVTALH